MTQLLRFSTFEELMFHQGSPAYPCEAFIRLCFEGQIRREEFESAVNHVCQQHPIFTFPIVNDHGRPKWDIANPSVPEIKWNKGPYSAQDQNIDILDVQQCGLRLIVLKDDETTSILFQFHHSCADGIGIFQFIHDLLLEYSARFDNTVRSTTTTAVDLRTIKNRNRFGLSFGDYLKLVPSQMIGLLGVRKFMMRFPAPMVPLKPLSASAGLPEPYPALLTHNFDHQTTSEYREQAKRRQVTFNDLLIRDTFASMQQFRREKGITGEDRWLRMMIPINMRGEKRESNTAANVVSSIFLDRRPTDIENSEELLDSVVAEMKRIKKHQLGFTFSASLSVIRRLPGGLRRQGSDVRRQPTAVLTNLGRTFVDSPLANEDGELVCGKATLRNIEIGSPLAGNTCVIFSANSYARKLSISLTYDSRQINSSDADRLLVLFAENMQQNS